MIRAATTFAGPCTGAPRRDFLLGLRHGQLVGAHVPSWCSRHGWTLVAPDELARLASLQLSRPDASGGYRADAVALERRDGLARLRADVVAEGDDAERTGLGGGLGKDRGRGALRLKPIGHGRERVEVDPPVRNSPPAAEQQAASLDHACNAPACLD